MKASGYLLDTNILSHILKQPKGSAAIRLREVACNNIFTSIIVAAELQFGIKKKASSKLQQRVKLLLNTIEILDFKTPADIYYGEIRHYLQKAGMLIGSNDLLIAAHALSENLIIVTDNVREFERVPNLLVENWLQE